MTVTASGIATVAAQEFRVRIRAGKWQWLLAIWFVILLGFTGLVFAALKIAQLNGSEIGTPLFGILMLFVLGLLLLIVPALTAQSINGDRERGTLATMQVTLLSASEIAVGKLLAAWATALVFVALSLPMVVWAMLAGGAPIGRVLATLAVIALLLGVICSIAQGLSAIFTRTVTSSVLSYIMIFVLTIGTLIAFAIAVALSTERSEESFMGETYESRRARPDRVWWILAPNPFVILADAAPALPLVPAPWNPNEMISPEGDVLGGIGTAVRAARQPPAPPIQSLEPTFSTPFPPEGAVQLPPPPPPPPVAALAPEPALDAVWPWGLAINLLLGLTFLAITIRRLQTPTRKLGRGVRVA